MNDADAKTIVNNLGEVLKKQEALRQLFRTKAFGCEHYIPDSKASREYTRHLCKCAEVWQAFVVKSNGVRNYCGIGTCPKLGQALEDNRTE